MSFSTAIDTNKFKLVNNSIIINGTIDSGIYTSKYPLILGNIQITDILNSKKPNALQKFELSANAVQVIIASSDFISNLDTVFPPVYTTNLSASLNNSSSYGFIEFNTTNTITISGTVDVSGMGYIGGNGFSSPSVGPYGATGIGGYAGQSINGDILNEKTKTQVLAASSTFYGNENKRNCVFPGSGGAGGAGLKSGAGGCGGGVVRLISNGTMTFLTNSKILTKGKKDGKNGDTPNLTKPIIQTPKNPKGVQCSIYIGKEDPTFATSKYGDICHGTHLINSGNTTSFNTDFINQLKNMWPQPVNSTGGRNLGNSKGGGVGNCCFKQIKINVPPYRKNIAVGPKGYFALGYRDWVSCTNKSGNEGLNKSYDIYSYEGWCNTGVDGYGGAGGGVLLKSYSKITASPQNFDLRGYDGTTNGGTLKIFHTGDTTSSLFYNNNTLSNKPSNELKLNIGGFYSEILASSQGYCLDDNTFKVQSLSSVETISSTTNTVGQETFDIAFTEGTPLIANSTDIKIIGYDLYRLIGLSASDYAGPEQPPATSSTNWTYITRITPQLQTGDFNLNTTSPIVINANGKLSITNPAPNTYNLSSIGPQNIINPTINQEQNDIYNRTWKYTESGWTLKNINEAFGYLYTDNTIYNTLSSLGYQINQQKEIVSDILNCKKALWYRISPIFAVNNIITSPCDIYKHPEFTNPTLNLTLSAILTTPYDIGPLTPSISGRIAGSDLKHYDKYYDNLKNNQISSVYGYDDLLVRAYIKVDANTFNLSSYSIDWGLSEAVQTIVAPFKNYFQDESIINADKTYVEPTQVGLFTLTPYKGKTKNVVSVSAIFNTNTYNQTATNYLVATGNVTIFEREPTPIFWLSAIDVPTVDRPESKPVGTNNVNKYSIKYDSPFSYHFNRTVSGFSSGVYVNFLDESIARTFPITAWTINYDRTNSDVFTITITSNTFADTQQLRTNAISSVTYTNAGIYYPTLTVKASTTNTGYDLSAVNRVIIYPPSPTASFIYNASSNAVSGFVPLFVTAIDTSIASIPLSTWKWDIYDSYNRTQVSETTTFYTSGNILQHNWKWHTDNYELSNITVDSSLNNLCLNVKSQGIGWRGENNSNNLRYGDKLIYAQDTICKHLYLYEKPQVPAIQIISAVTYTSSFTDDTPNYNEITAFTTSNYISGNCPYLKVTLKEVCTAKSYPISSYIWNFGDYFLDSSNISSINLPANSLILSGWTYPFPTNHGPTGDDNYPLWQTSATNHTVEHAYVLPGDYLVTLTTKVSTTNTTRTTNLTVHMEETPPICDLLASYDGITWTQVSAISGQSPLTVYFTTTGSTAGSFPIGRLVLDFDDDTGFTTIDRYINNYNESPYGSDPRYYNDGIIEHTFTRKIASESSTYNVSLSVIADMSNTVSVCSGNQLGPVNLPELNVGDIHIIKSRNYSCNNNLLVIQNQNDKSTYNILLSGN